MTSGEETIFISANTVLKSAAPFETFLCQHYGRTVNCRCVYDDIHIYLAEGDSVKAYLRDIWDKVAVIDKPSNRVLSLCRYFETVYISVSTSRCSHVSCTLCIVG